MTGKLLYMTNKLMTKLSAAAVSALIDAPANREGAVPKAAPFVLAELSAAGLIGVKGGLTRAGVIRRERESAALLDSLF